LPVVHYGALQASTVFKLAGSPSFHAVADICLDGAALYQVHRTKPSACGTLR
jgi:hypothetical protein